jgi:hypothetical protein
VSFPTFIARLDRRARTAILAVGIGCLLAIPLRPAPAHADDLQESAQHLSDTAFNLLNSLSSDSSKAGATDVMGDLASFAGDAQTVASALGKGDKAAAAQAMNALVADRRSLDSAVAKNPGAISSSQWDSIKVELASLERRLPPASGPIAKAGPSTAPPAEPPVVPPPLTESTAPTPGGTAPKVEITKRVTDDAGVHLKGYLEGYDLKSAGIYDGDTLVTPIELSPTREGQRVNFNFTVQDVTASQSIRVEDHMGRIAAARMAAGPEAAVERSGHEKMIELGGGPHEAGPPPMVASKGTGGGTTVIPSRSPSRRHIHENPTVSPLTDVQINILQVTQSLSAPNTYQVVGQISGEGVKRAGIYVDGKLVKPIPMTPGAYTSFDTSFMLLGKEPTVRAYGNGTNFVEASIDLNTGAGTVYSSNPPLTPYYPINPYARANPYGYPPNAYGTDPYGRPYGPPPYGSGGGYPPPNYGYPPPSRPWWQKLF